MMHYLNKTALLAFVVILACALSGKVEAEEPQLAAEKTQAIQVQQEPSVELMAVSGTIQSVDAVKGELVLKTGLLSSQQFTIKADTAIRDGARSLDPTQLVPGSQVQVKYTDEEGHEVAREITLEGNPRG